MEIQKKWAMPSGDTFGIKPIKELFDKYNKGGVIIDPFAKDCKLGTIRNDLNPNCDTQYHLDALKFLQGQKSNSADMVLYDPPYSVTQQGSLAATRPFRLSAEAFRRVGWPGRGISQGAECASALRSRR